MKKSNPLKHVSCAIAFGITWITANASEAPISRHNLTSAQYQNLAVNYDNDGYRLQQVSGYEVNGSARYAAFWLKENGPDLATHHGMTGADYQNGPP